MALRFQVVLLCVVCASTLDWNEWLNAGAASTSGAHQTCNRSTECTWKAPFCRDGVCMTAHQVWHNGISVGARSKDNTVAIRAQQANPKIHAASTSPLDYGWICKMKGNSRRRLHSGGGFSFTAQHIDAFVSKIMSNIKAPEATSLASPVSGNSDGTSVQGLANVEILAGTNMFIGDVAPDTLMDIVNDDDIEGCYQNSEVEAQALQLSPPSWGVDRVDQRDGGGTLNGLFDSGAADGEGADVYIVDTGIYKQHSDFMGRLKGGFNAVSDGEGTNGWDDCNGHGTHCAGSAAGTLYGLCKKCNVYGVRVLGQPSAAGDSDAAKRAKRCSKSGSWASVLKGLNWVVEQSATGGLSAGRPVVASMSIGGGKNQAINDAVKAMTQAGVIPVIAAGNAARDACLESPGSEPTAITVGATDKTDKIWRWSSSAGSNWGSCVDILAPGVAIKSTWHGSPDASKVQTGTSMATPHVAGAAAIEAALLFGTSGSKPTTDQIRDVLLQKSTLNKIDLGTNAPGTPNRLLFTAFTQPMPDYYSQTPNHAPFTTTQRRLRTSA